MSNEVAFMPNTYLDRKGLPSGAKYLFVSYSHKSSEIVYQDLNKLFDAGLNFWYDKELCNGDIWYEKVERCLADENCCGVIFFFDINCLMGGGAIEKEIELFEKYNCIRKNLFSFCVISPNDESVYSIVRNSFLLCSDFNTKQLQNALPESRVLTVLKAFNQDKIYKLRTGNYIQEIIEDVRKQNPDAISDAKNNLSKLKEKFADKLCRVDDIYELLFGTYPSTEYEGIRDFVMVNDIYQFGNGDRIVKSSNTLYAFKPIKWMLTNVNDDTADFVAKNIIDVCEGDNSVLTQWLTKFYDIAFTQEEKQIVSGMPYLPSVEDVKKTEGKIDKISETEFAEKSNELPYKFAWLSDMETVRKRKTFCGFNGSVAYIDFNFTDAYGGIMPAIKIKLNN